MRFLRPIPFNVPKDVMLVNIFYSVNVADIFHPATYFVKSFKGLSIGKPTEVSYMGEIPPSEEDRHLYFGTQNHVNNCVNNAETVNLKLKNVLEKLILDPDVKNELVILDFIKRRDLLSDFLKSWSPLKLIQQFDTNKKLKNITKGFHDFITDRNIYTHGALHLLLPEKVILIEHVQRSTMTYSLINSEILLSYNNAYRIIFTFLSLIESLYNQSDKERVDSILNQYNRLLSNL